MAMAGVSICGAGGAEREAMDEVESDEDSEENGGYEPDGADATEVSSDADDDHGGSVQIPICLFGSATPTKTAVGAGGRVRQEGKQRLGRPPRGQ